MYHEDSGSLRRVLHGPEREGSSTGACSSSRAPKKPLQLGKRSARNAKKAAYMDRQGEDVRISVSCPCCVVL